MRILHINHSDAAGGGAAIASNCLHRALLEQNVSSRMLVSNKEGKGGDVRRLQRGAKIERFTVRLGRKLGLNDVGLLSTFGLTKHNWYLSSDILNFHNLHSNYFNYLALPHITRHKPAVWTLHDMWSFTGHCAYSFDCQRWQTGCGKCPALEIYPAVRRDNTRIEWQLKQWVYQLSNIHIITLSHWLTEQARKSQLNCLPIHHIPNGIDTEAYKPLDKGQCRSQLAIPQDKKVLMFAACGLSDARKGGDLLIECLQKLADNQKKEVVLVTFGKENKDLADSVDIPIYNLGYISDEYRKSMAYSAADIFVCPTRADNLPLVLQESMACGTPMVSFDVGGVPDLVRPQQTGLLAKPENPEDMAQKITVLLEDENLRQKMSANCRQIAVEEYTIELQAQRYIKLYNRILKEEN